MSHDPLYDIAEILGEPAEEMRSPASVDYRCPFLAEQCRKTSHHLTTSFPVCSIYRRGQSGTASDEEPICVCPHRFLEAEIQADVIRECWIGDPPENPVLVSEVNMERYGTVDFVVADLNESRTAVRDFVSVELQAVDITGSYLGSYEAITNNKVMERRPTYGFNWANVRKRFVSQLIAKGFHHHHWDTRIVAAVQENLFAQFDKHASIPTVAIADSNIVFLLYQFVRNGNRWSMRFRRAVPTTHALLMTASLYERPPDRSVFEKRILHRISS